MGYLSFNEKAWDKVRPFAVKKTGVSEAIRAFEKAVPNKLEDLQTQAACKTAAELLDTLAEKLAGAKRQLDAKKHAKEITQVGAWIGEVGVRKKAIGTHEAKLKKDHDDAITEANKLIDPYFEEVEDLMSTARELLSQLQDRAKAATVAGVKGETDKVLKCHEYAEQAKNGFDRILSEARGLHPKALKAASGKLPKPEVLTDPLQHKRSQTADRVTAIKYKAQAIEDMLQSIRDALETITFAGAKSDDLHEKFAKMVNADSQLCGTLAVELERSQTAVDTDMQRVGEILKRAGQPETEKSETARLLGDAANLLKVTATKLKRLHTDIANLDKTVTTKTADYPDFVTVKDERFKQPLKQFVEVKKMVSELNDEAYPGFVQKARTYGQKLTELSRS